MIFFSFNIPYNLTHHRMFTSKVWTGDGRLLQESNLSSRQPQGATSIIQGITSEGLAQGPYVAARVGFKPATICTEGTKHHHWATTPPDGSLIIADSFCGMMRHVYFSMLFLICLIWSIARNFFVICRSRKNKKWINVIFQKITPTSVRSAIEVSKQKTCTQLMLTATKR